MNCSYKSTNFLLAGHNLTADCFKRIFDYFIIVYVTGFQKTYHLHTNEIIKISDFAPLWL